MNRTYDVNAIQMTIWFNREGDHDHNGLIYVLRRNLPLVKYLRELALATPDQAELDLLRPEAQALATQFQVPFPTTMAEAQQPHPFVRPLVLRANLGDVVTVNLENEIQSRAVGMHLVGDGYDVGQDDGSEVGANPPSLAPPGGTWTYSWEAAAEGVFPFHDGGDYSGGEDGTNVHGLFGGFIVEPVGAIWRDPVSGQYGSEYEQLDGLYLDVIPPEAQGTFPLTAPATIENYEFPPPEQYHDFNIVAHREFVIFFHDEPEFVPPHGALAPDPCAGGNGGGGGGEHGHGGGHILPIMPISYRAEPMVNREQALFRLIQQGHDFKGRPVLNEEQHHASWMFGDPVTPILKAYIGDPVRIRFIHAAVKETHVFHLHLYEWHAVPQDRDSPRIDAISVSPQTAHTIEPLWGAGNRHQVAGDVIFHCHLYPHFHEGMWGMFRTFETLQDGNCGQLLASQAGNYAGRRIGHYPDGSRIERLLPLPDRIPPPKPTASHPGYPLYIPGEMQQKSPIPPWPLAEAMPADLDYRPNPTHLERNAFNDQPVPGEIFTRRPFAVGQAQEWPVGQTMPAGQPRYHLNPDRLVQHDLVVDKMRIDYNGHGWHDKDGHLFYLAAEGRPAADEQKEPLFFRARHGQILNLSLRNDLPLDIAETEFDPAFPPCPARPWQSECTLHVHMVKFDPICADGASVGWNYISGPVAGKKMRYRWWLDQEFGSIFFHDHLFANYRQKHGLFGALIVEPAGARFFANNSPAEIVSGMQARIELPGPSPRAFREFCMGLQDFIPMWDGDGIALNPPPAPGGHGDQGIMAINYRNDPIHERLRDSGGAFIDPALWFSSGPPYNRDPYSVRFDTIANDQIRFRIVQGSHEEQHSFQVHGLRWRRFRGNPDSAIRDQQSFGISEAFTFIQEEPYGPGDYMYKLTGADDLWLGCWGLIRAFGFHDPSRPAALSTSSNLALEPAFPTGTREFQVTAVQRRLVYRDPELVDPFGLVYRLDKIIGPDGAEIPVRQKQAAGEEEPLILRCRQGETVKIVLTNGIPANADIRPEPFAPTVPVEEQDGSHRPVRPVSLQVSMHADLLRYDVTTSDGATVGRNPDQTAAPGETITYYWETDQPLRSTEFDPHAGPPLGPLLLQDMADFRNHRHHGLVGALIVEPSDAAALYVPDGSDTAGTSSTDEAWDGPRATVTATVDGQEKTYEEAVLLLQDGLRFFVRGHLGLPVSDEPPGPGEDDVDHEDQGQKGFNYKSEPIERYLSDPAPATPIFHVPANADVRLHLIGACDKPRQHSFTVHGVTWPEYRHLGDDSPRVASEAAIAGGTARTFDFKVGAPADHAYRSGVLKWAVRQGLWGLFRVGA